MYFGCFNENRTIILPITATLFALEVMEAADESRESLLAHKEGEEVSLEPSTEGDKETIKAPIVEMRDNTAENALPPYPTLSSSFLVEASVLSNDNFYFSPLICPFL